MTDNNKLYIYSSDLMPLVTNENVANKQLYFKFNNVFVVEIIKSFHIDLSIGVYIFSYELLKNLKKRYDSIVSNYMPLYILLFEPLLESSTLPVNNWEYVDGESKVFAKPMQFLLIHFSLPCKQNYKNDVLALKKFVNCFNVDTLSHTYYCFSFFNLNDFQNNQGLKCIFSQFSEIVIKEYDCKPLLLSIKQCTLYHAI